MLNINDKIITEFLPQYGPKAFAVLSVLSKHMNKERRCWPSPKTIEKMAKVGRDSRRKITKQLEADGFIRVHEVRDVQGIIVRREYEITTNLISWYGGSENPQPEIQSLDVDSLPPPENKATSTALKSGGGNPPPENQSTEVLSIGSINNPLSIEQINKIKEEGNLLQVLHEKLIQYFFVTNSTQKDYIISSAMYRGSEEDFKILLLRFCAYYSIRDESFVKNLLNGEIWKASSGVAFWLTDPRSKKSIKDEGRYIKRGKSSTEKISRKSKSLAERAADYKQANWFNIY